MNELALFAGAGGGILGGHLLGWRTVCAVEWEPYPASVLCARQNDNFLPPFPIWDDVQTFDGKPWKGIVDVVSGGFPCTDISAAGKGAGIDGEASGMWREMARIIHEVQPRYAFVENSPMLTSRGLGRVLGDLAAMGFNAKWGMLGADAIGACHHRERIWILAYTDSNGLESYREIGNTKTARGQEWGWASEQTTIPICPQIQHENAVSSARDTDEVAARVDRLKAIGNGQVPLCAATAWKLLSETRS
jgi:DNA (cytosine-5)-methyltransferase 1